MKFNRLLFSISIFKGSCRASGLEPNLELISKLIMESIACIL